MDHKACKAYFNDTDHRIVGAFLIVFGIAAAITGVVFLTGGGVWAWLPITGGTAAAVIGAVCILRSRKITDGEYDSIVTGYITPNIQGWALEKLGLSPTDVCRLKPMVLGGYCFEENAMIKVGKDGVGRSSRYNAAILLFSGREVYCYIISIDTIGGGSFVSTRVYLYKNIESVSTRTETVTLRYQNRSYDISDERFEIAASDGTGLSFSLSAASENVNNSINQMRSLINGSK